MEKKYVIIGVVVLILIIATVVVLRLPEDVWVCEDGSWVQHGNPDQPMPTIPCEKTKITDENFACTEDVKICPDGSSVGRTGSNCEFSPCPKVESLIPEEEARTIAEKFCIKGGEALGDVIYNKNSKTWWYDANLNSVREGCNPACVVDENTKTAGINWRCLGLK